MNLPKTHTATTCLVSINSRGGYFSPEGYSKYMQRCEQEKEHGNTHPGIPFTSYGYEQALEHIAEIREKEYEGKKVYADKTFTISIITTVTTDISVPAK